MALLTQAPKGTQDLLPRESAKWRTAEEVMRSEAAVLGFGEVRTPVFEHTELFLRSVGDTTDVVEKQMYTFEEQRRTFRDLASGRNGRGGPCHAGTRHV